MLNKKFKIDDNQIRKDIIGRGRKSQVWLNEHANLNGYGPTNFHRNFVDLYSEFGYVRKTAAERMAAKIINDLHRSLTK